MTLCVIFPPDGAPILHLPEAVDGQLSYVEAWPGSVICDQEPDGSLHLHGFVLGVSGGLPPDKFGFLCVVPLDQVDTTREREASFLKELRRRHAHMRRLTAEGRAP